MRPIRDRHFSKFVWSIVLSTVGAVTASLLLTAFLAPWFGIMLSARGFLFAFLIPTIIAPLWSIPRARANYRLRKLHDELEKLARTDSLSGLMNRRAFFERANELFAMPPAWPIGLMMFDVDDFKAINDNHGHEFGDGVIRAVATTIVDTVVAATAPRPDIGAPTIARFGGEEFVVLVEGPDEAALLRLADEVRGAIEKFVRLEVAMTTPATVSGGVTLREPGQNIDATLRAADAALYEAKRAGRNCVRLASRAGAEAALVPLLPGTSIRDRKRAADAA